MMFNRNIRVTTFNEQGLGIVLDERFDIVLNIKKQIGNEPVSTIKIYNLKPQTANNVKDAYRCIVEVGSDDYTLIYDGLITDVVLDHEGIDNFALITTQGYNSKLDTLIFKKSYKGLTQRRQILDDILRYTTIPYSIPDTLDLSFSVLICGINSVATLD